MQLHGKKKICGQGKRTTVCDINTAVNAAERDLKRSALKKLCLDVENSLDRDHCRFTNALCEQTKWSM